MNMKKFLVFLLVLLLTLSMAACGGGGDTNDDSDPNGGNNGSQIDGNDDTDSDPDEEITFEDSLKDDDIYQNYYFELESSLNGEVTPTSKFWFLNGDMKFESDEQAIFLKPSEEQMGIYTKETNQLVMMPLSDTEDFYTPFTAVDEIEDDMFDSIAYKGTEELDGKTVEVFEYDAMDVYAKYYIWKDTGIIIKMIINADEYESEYYFKNMTVNELTDEDLDFPEDAQKMDMSEYMDE